MNDFQQFSIGGSAGIFKRKSGPTGNQIQARGDHPFDFPILLIIKRMPVLQHRDGNRLAVLDKLALFLGEDDGIDVFVGEIFIVEIGGKIGVCGIDGAHGLGQLFTQIRSFAGRDNIVRVGFDLSGYVIALFHVDIIAVQEINLLFL